ncbi:MAG: Crp/Fnr family transcriptional regulator [Methylococcaceae bacterium]
MSATTSMRVFNRLIGGLPAKKRSKILECCEPVELALGVILCEPAKPFRHVYFPLTAIISLVTTLGLHKPLEIGLIGNEGMLGATLALGVSTAPERGVVQGAGFALRMTAAEFRRILRETPGLQRTLNRYLFVLMTQFSQTAACTHFHEIEPRLARWLLMTHDRAHADHFHLTHELLAEMLGVRRSGVTLAAGALQQRKLIKYTRGEINILDRRGLEAASCKCYDAVIEDYARMLG